MTTGVSNGPTGAPETTGYSFSLDPAGDGRRYRFDGPGVPRYANFVALDRAYDAETIARMLGLAFEAGRRAKAEEVRSVLEIHRA